MTGCDDGFGDGTEATSVEELRSTFESLADAFDDEAARNVQDRADGEPVGAPHGAVAQFPADPQPPFNPRPVLLLPHADGDAGRPLTRRSEATGDGIPPVHSDGIDVDVTRLEAGEAAEVGVTVQNLGGLPARNVTVECFVEHYRPDARVDRSDLLGPRGDAVPGGADGAVELARSTDPLTPTAHHTVEGVTTVAPGSTVTVYAVVDDGPPFQEVLGHGPNVTVADDRTFEAVLHGKPDEFTHGTEVPSDRDDFTLEVWDTTAVRPHLEDVPDQWDPKVYHDPTNFGGVHLASVPGRFVDEPATPERADQFLAGSVEGERTERVGRRTTAIPGNGAETLTFTYEPAADELPDDSERADVPDGRWERDPGPGAGNTVTAFYARAYDLASAELPSDWSALDHTTSRFVNRTELPRVP